MGKKKDKKEKGKKGAATEIERKNGGKDRRKLARK